MVKRKYVQASPFIIENANDCQQGNENLACLTIQRGHARNVGMSMSSSALRAPQINGIAALTGIHRLGIRLQEIILFLKSQTPASCIQMPGLHEAQQISAEINSSREGPRHGQWRGLKPLLYHRRYQQGLGTDHMPMAVIESTSVVGYLHQPP